MFPRCEVTKHSSKRIYDIVVVAVHCSSLPHTIAVFYDLGFFRQRTTFAVMTRVRNNLPLVYNFVCSIMSLHYYKCCLSQLTFLLHKPDYGWTQTYKVYQCAEHVAMLLLWQHVACSGKCMKRKTQETSFVESLYDDTGLPSGHGRATRSVSFRSYHTHILSSCVVLSATFLTWSVLIFVTECTWQWTNM